MRSQASRTPDTCYVGKSRNPWLLELEWAYKKREINLPV